jgi:hypothetical protein
MMAATTEGKSKRSKGLGGSIGLGLFVLIGLPVTLAADAFLGWNAYWQVRAQGFATTAGIVTHSEVESHQGDHGPVFSADLKYKYHAAGKQYSGDRYRYGQGSSNDDNARRIVADHPVGKQVAVYYHPGNPADALLRPGLDGSDLFLAMFLLPFNLVLLAVWSVLGGQVWYRMVQPPAGGAKVWDDGFQARVRLTQISPFAVGAVAAGVTAFVAIFIVAFGFGGFHPPLQVMHAAWPVILAAGLLGYVGYWRRLAQGGRDLVIDATGGKVKLPRTMGRKTDVVLPLADIRDVELQRVARGWSGNEPWYWYVPTLVVADAGGSPRHEKLVEWWNEGRAEGLASWLRDAVAKKSLAA